MPSQGPGDRGAGIGEARRLRVPCPQQEGRGPQPDELQHRGRTGRDGRGHLRVREQGRNRTRHRRAQGRPGDLRGLAPEEGVRGLRGTRDGPRCGRPGQGRVGILRREGDGGGGLHPPDPGVRDGPQRQDRPPRGVRRQGGDPRLQDRRLRPLRERVHRPALRLREGRGEVLREEGGLRH